MTIDRRDWQKYPWSFTVQNPADGATETKPVLDRCPVCHVEGGQHQRGCRNASGVFSTAAFPEANDPAHPDYVAAQAVESVYIADHEASGEFRLEHGPICSVGCHDECAAGEFHDECMSPRRRLWLKGIR